jgi:hypothetical protein
MKSIVRVALVAVALGGLAVLPTGADPADDDLVAVRRAVSASRVAQARPPAEDTDARPSKPTRPAEGKWLRIRVVERGGKHGKVRINLPLGFVRAFGEDWPVHGCSRCDSARRMTFGDVLRALDSGQSLVEIDDDDASVRVWVD